jgi:hypothetical protein
VLEKIKNDYMPEEKETSEDEHVQDSFWPRHVQWTVWSFAMKTLGLAAFSWIKSWSRVSWQWSIIAKVSDYSTYRISCRVPHIWHLTYAFYVCDCAFAFFNNGCSRATQKVHSCLNPW